MIKKLLLFFVLCFSAKVFSYNIPVNTDTSKQHILYELANRQPYPSEYKINKNSFYLRYGFDNTAIKIIDYFFAKQKKYVILICLPVMVGLFLSIVAIFSFSTSTLFALIALVVMLLYIISWVLRFVGIIGLIKNKKINLLNQLIEYRKTGAYTLDNKTKKRVNYNDDFYYEKK